MSSSEERGLYDLVAADAWYKAALKYSNPTRCNRYLKNISWSRVGVCISGYAASAMLMYMGHEHSPLLCLGHQAADCNASLLGYGGGGIICMASLVYSVYTACLNYGCCRPSGRAERVEDAGLQKYCYIMSAICAEWSAYSAPCSLNDH